MTVEPSSGFMAWISQYGQLILFFAQLLFWLAVSVAALWSTMLFKKLVEARTADTAAPSLGSTATADKPSVDEFVD